MRAALWLSLLVLIPTAGEARLCGWLNASSAISEASAIFEGEVLGWYSRSLSGAGGPRYLRLRVLREFKGQMKLPYALVNIPCSSDQFEKGQRVLSFTRGSALIFHESVSEAGAVAVLPGFSEGATPEETVKNALVRALDAKSIRAAALRQLATFKSPEVSEAIGRFSDEEDGIVRSRARAYLAQEGNTRVMREVVSELMSPRLNADRGIGSVYGTPEYVIQQELFTYYGLLSGFGGRCSVANRKEEMGQQPERPKSLEDAKLAQAVAPLRSHRNGQIREGVSMFLRECRSTASTKLLLEMMEDDDERVSYHAMMGLCMRMNLRHCPGQLHFNSNKNGYISLIRTAVSGKRVELPRGR